MIKFSNGPISLKILLQDILPVAKRLKEKKYSNMKNYIYEMFDTWSRIGGAFLIEKGYSFLNLSHVFATVTIYSGIFKHTLAQFFTLLK